VQRFLYFAGFTYIALCGAILVREALARRPVHAGVDAPPVPIVPRTDGSAAEQWFSAMKPYCNSVEVDVRIRQTPAPRTPQGSGFAAACLALAGRIDRARTIISQLPRGDQGAAASVLFNVAHPVADAGDDVASGPMMQVVLEYWPNNYMALYHAGMSEYALGETALAEKHLRAFLEMYVAPDGFRSAAKAALWKIERRARQSAPRRVERETTPRP
jgi:hypothetical protein